MHSVFINVASMYTLFETVMLSIGLKVGIYFSTLANKWSKKITIPWSMSSIHLFNFWSKLRKTISFVIIDQRARTVHTKRSCWIIASPSKTVHPHFNLATNVLKKSDSDCNFHTLRECRADYCSLMRLHVTTAKHKNYGNRLSVATNDWLTEEKTFS